MLAENLNLFQSENLQELQGYDPSSDLKVDQSIMIDSDANPLYPDKDSPMEHLSEKSEEPGRDRSNTMGSEAKNPITISDEAQSTLTQTSETVKTENKEENSTVPQASESDLIEKQPEEPTVSELKDPQPSQIEKQHEDPEV